MRGASAWTLNTFAHRSLGSQNNFEAASLSMFEKEVIAVEYQLSEGDKNATKVSQKRVA